MRGLASILLALFPFAAVADTETTEVARPDLPDLSSAEPKNNAASSSEDDATCSEPPANNAGGDPSTDGKNDEGQYYDNGGADDGEPPIDIGPTSSLLDESLFLVEEDVPADIRENKLVAIRDAFKVRSDQSIDLLDFLCHPQSPVLFLSQTAGVCGVGTLHPVQRKTLDKTATIRIRFLILRYCYTSRI